MSASLGTARLQTAEQDWLIRPRKSNGVGVILCHGAGGTVAAWADHLYERQLVAKLARAGFTCWAGELGGTETWGNDLSETRADAVQAALVGIGCDPEVIVLGMSMGHLTACRWAMDNPTATRAVVGLMPAVDIDDIRTRDALGRASDIEAAWGIGPSDPVPARGKVLDRAAELTSIPWAAWYGEDDTVTLATKVRAFAAACGQPQNAFQTDDSGLDHSSVFLSFPQDDIVTWLVENTHLTVT